MTDVDTDYPLPRSWSYWETVLKRKVSLRNAGWDDQKHVKLFDAKSGKELVSKLATMPSVPDGFVLNALPERPIKYVRGTGEQASAVLNYYHFCDSNYSSPDYKCEVDNERLAKNGFTVQFAANLDTLNEIWAKLVLSLAAEECPDFRIINSVTLATELARGTYNTSISFWFSSLSNFHCIKALLKLIFSIKLNLSSEDKYLRFSKIGYFTTKYTRRDKEFRFEISPKKIASLTSSPDEEIDAFINDVHPFAQWTGIPPLEEEGKAENFAVKKEDQAA